MEEDGRSAFIPAGLPLDPRSSQEEAVRVITGAARGASADGPRRLGAEKGRGVRAAGRAGREMLSVLSVLRMRAGGGC